MRLPLLSRAILLPLSFAFMMFTAGHALAETTNCTYLNGPTVPQAPPPPYSITASGVYCLGADVIVPSSFPAGGSVVSIGAGGVVLDLNGHRIDGNALGTANTSKGIAVGAGLREVVIRNGIVRAFWYGIYIADPSPYTMSRGHLIENILAESNTFIGISASGRGMLIQNNQIVTTGGSTYSGFNGNASAVGIQVVGPGNHILNNDIVTLTAQGTGVSTAIQFYGSTCALGDSMAVNNRINDAMHGIEYNCGIGKYRDNLTSSVSTPYLGGTDAGNNN